MGEHLELWTTVDNSGLQWTTIVYNGLQCTAMDYSSLQWTTLVYSGLQWISAFRDPSSLHVMSNLQCPDMMSGRRVNPNPDIRERERERKSGAGHGTWLLQNWCQSVDSEDPDSVSNRVPVNGGVNRFCSRVDTSDLLGIRHHLIIFVPAQERLDLQRFDCRQRSLIARRMNYVTETMHYEGLGTQWHY